MVHDDQRRLREADTSRVAKGEGCGNLIDITVKLDYLTLDEVNKTASFTLSVPDAADLRDDITDWMSDIGARDN